MELGSQLVGVRQVVGSAEVAGDGVLQGLEFGVWDLGVSANRGP